MAIVRQISKWDLLKCPLLEVEWYRIQVLQLQMFDTLRNASIPVKMVSTSEIKVSVVIPESEMEKAVAVLHEQFGLDKQ